MTVGDTDIEFGDPVFEPSQARWCYSGKHTVKPLAVSEKSRVSSDIVTIETSANMQSEIDALPQNVRILTITKPSAGYIDDQIRPKLAVSMPQLETVRLIDVCFSKIKFNESLTPKLQSIEMQNVPSDCQMDVLSPQLKHFEMNYYNPPRDETWIHRMLASATQLQTFDSYKLCVTTLTFASNHLVRIKLHRSDILSELTIWAPALEELNLQACYDLERLYILEDHALNDPRRFKVSTDTMETWRNEPGNTATRFSPIQVNTTNACLSEQVVLTLQSNDRVIWEPDEDDGY